MYDRLRKFIVSILVFSITIGATGVIGVQKAYGQKNSVSNLEGIMLTDEEISTYQGIDLASIQFDTSKMNEKERALRSSFGKRI